METNIGIQEGKTGLITTKLNRILANNYILYAKLQVAHWNLISADFFSVHKFLETLYSEVYDWIDSIAERIRVYGVRVQARLATLVSMAEIKEEQIDYTDSQTAIRQFVLDYETVIKSTREVVRLMTNEYKDDGSANFLVELMTMYEKHAYLLRSHIR